MDFIYLDSCFLIYLIEGEERIQLEAKKSLSDIYKSPDAIHLATAILSNCNIFLTGDKKLQSCSEVNVFVIE